MSERRSAVMSATGEDRRRDLSALGPEAARLCAWMRERALPLWAEQGWDDAAGTFREKLGYGGTPCPEPFRRTMVQARQIYVFSAARLMGWEGPALEIAWRGYEHLVAHRWLDDGGWAHRLDTAGNVIDATRDAYDHAFVLFALAWLHRASGAEEPLGWARRTLDWIEVAMIDPVHGGCRESLPDRLPRRANPQMHLLEALVALHDATGDADYLRRAADYIELFRTRLFASETGTLREFFDADWSPAAGAEGDHREPGHHFEWAWLLDACERKYGTTFAPHIDALRHFADVCGTAGETGLVHDSLDDRGGSPSGNHRLWGQTEAARARAMLALRGERGEAEKAAAHVRAIFRYHLDARPEGLWHDRIDATGTPLDRTVPASSLYHLMTLVWDLEMRLPAAHAIS